MNGVTRKESHQCEQCGRRLRNSVFCTFCGEVLCSWVCYLRHVVAHAGIRGNTPSPPAGVEPRPVGEQAGAKADFPGS